MTATRQQRIAWLLDHKDVWAGWPDEALSLMYGPWLGKWQAIVKAWKRLGLLSLNTHWRDVGLPGLIAAARKQRREGKS